jgi:antitoxin HicB
MVPFRYRIVSECSDADGAFVPRVPALPGCAANGATAEQATHEARRAAEAMIAVLSEDGDPPPPVDSSADYSGQLRLRLPRSLHAKLSREATAEGVSLNTVMLYKLAIGGRPARRGKAYESGLSIKEGRRGKATRARRKAS